MGKRSELDVKTLQQVPWNTASPPFFYPKGISNKTLDYMHFLFFAPCMILN